MGQRINRICLDKAAELPGVFRRAAAFYIDFYFFLCNNENIYHYHILPETGCL